MHGARIGSLSYPLPYSVSETERGERLREARAGRVACVRTAQKLRAVFQDTLQPTPAASAPVLPQFLSYWPLETMPSVTWGVISLPSPLALGRHRRGRKYSGGARGSGAGPSRPQRGQLAASRSASGECRVGPGEGASPKVISQRGGSTRGY